MALSREQECGNFLRVAVKVDENRLVDGEERVEGVLRQGMRVLSVFTEDHEVDNVDDSDSDTFGSEEGRGRNDLVRYLYSDTNEYDIRLHSVVRRVFSPDRRPSDAMSFAFFDV